MIQTRHSERADCILQLLEQVQVNKFLIPHAWTVVIPCLHGINVDGVS